MTQCVCGGLKAFVPQTHFRHDGTIEVRYLHNDLADLYTALSSIEEQIERLADAVYEIVAVLSNKE